MQIHSFSQLKTNQEFQSSLVRFAIWTFGVAFVLVGTLVGRFDVDLVHFLVAAVVALLFFSAVFLSILIWPDSRWRPYVSIFGDIAANTLLLIFIADPLNPFFLMYLWFSFYAGARYGKGPMLVAMTAGAAAYSGLLSYYDVWQTAPFDAGFYLLILVILPLYVNLLLKRILTARHSAEVANRARGDFLAHVSHELRTPLNGLTGMAWMLRTTKLDDEQREYVSSLLTAAKTLQALIGDVLDLAKIDAKKMDLQETSFDPAAVLLEICQGLRPHWRGKRLEMVCDLDPALPDLIKGDDLRFRQIFLNLVGNAVKFTASGTVTIRMNADSPVSDMSPVMLHVEVQDTGPGLSSELAARVFQPFVQGDSSIRRRYGGSGLGTTISGELTRIMGGDISCDSRLGEGARFHVRLPLLPAGFRRSAPQEGGLTGKRAVLLDDHPGSRAAITAALEYEGMKVVQVDSLEETQQLPSADVWVVTRRPQPEEDVPSLPHAPAGVPIVILDDVLGMEPVFQETDLAVLPRPFAAKRLLSTVKRLLAPAPQEQDAPLDVLVVGDELARTSVAPLRVLIAEDDDLNARLIAHFVTKSGHHPRVVSDGREALNAALSDSFDLALVDVRMPRMSGIDFVRRYREMETADRHLRVVSLTADATADTRAACLDAGADAVFTKPVDPEEILRLLDNSVVRSALVPAGG